MPAIQHILCPVDFSPTSEHALNFATVIARRLKAQVTLLHTYSMPNFVMPEGAMLPDAELSTQLSTEAQTRLNELLAKYNQRGVHLKGELKLGAPSTEISRVASEDKADLIVMGTHGRTGLEHALLGSVAERVVRSSTVPVLTIREPHAGDKHAQTLTADVKRIVCPVDFSDASAKATTYAAELARQLGAELHLLHVLPTVAYAMVAESYTVKPDLVRELKQEVKQRVEDLRASLASDTLKVEASMVEGVPYKAIHEAAHKLNADLLVMGTHGRTGFAHLLLGSVTERVVRTSTIPVLTVHPGLTP